MSLYNHQSFLLALTVIQLFITSFVCSASVGVHNHGASADLYNNFTTYEFGQSYKDLYKVKSFFHQFGYLSNTPPFNDNYDDTLVSAIQTYQKYYNLKVTGKLDHDTVQHISVPRCGVPDINTGKHPNYVFFNGSNGPPRYPPGTTKLTYAFLPENKVIDKFKHVFAIVFNRWSSVIKIQFEETASYDTANIKIGFYKGNHGDWPPFDGQGGQWAHAFAPTYGQAHFDIQENWKPDITGLTDPTSTDLESIAMHEIGHVLGLYHTPVQSAIMYAYINSLTRKVELTDDDIQGIRKLYGL
ncbi:hypothetical protein VNO77_40014 [Canavalia gladiata]|uniref:Peptidase metallopeptidase domain-containing protein n=1 Tax=Canavalia gladiata TaxID=3824 RepID=A0AAN9JZB0_CANGL